MIKKLLKKTITSFLFIVTFFLNTGFFPLIKTKVEIKKIEKEALPKNLHFTFEERLQCKPIEKPIAYNPETPLWEKPIHPLSYIGYNEQNIPRQAPQSGQFTLMVSDSSSSVIGRPVVINFDYITNIPTHNIKIQDIRIDIAEPKDFLAKDLNEEWKEKIIFYHNSSVYPKEKNTDT